MNEHPIQNEPGWETEIGQKSKDFNTIISYYNIETNIIKALENIPEDYNMFKDIMASYFVKNIKKYNKILEKNQKMEGKKKLKSGIYSMILPIYDLEYLRKEIELLYSKYDMLYGN